MPTFTIDSIRDQFATDAAQMLSETLEHARALLKKKPDAPAKRIAELKRHGHSLKGLAGLVSARGLEAWGETLEALATAVDTSKNPGERQALLHCILSTEKAWAQMNEQSLAGDLRGATGTYAGLRAAAPSALREHFKPVDETRDEILTAEGFTAAAAAPSPILPPLMSRATADRTTVLAPSPILPPLRAKKEPGQGVAATPILPTLLAKNPAAPQPPQQPAGPNKSAAAAAPIMPPLKAKAAPTAVEVDAELVEFFVEDAEDQVRSLERAALAWEQGENIPEQQASVRRAYHTLKGAANSVGLTKLGGEFHHAEDYIEKIVDGSVATSRGFFQFLLKSVDQLRAATAVLKAGKPLAWPHDWATALIQIQKTPAAKAAIPATKPAPTQSPAAAATVPTAPAAPATVDAELLSVFVEDATDQIQTLERATTRWEQQDEPGEQRAAARRAFHTLKGAANSVGLTTMGAEFSRAEQLIEGIADGRYPVSLPLFVFLNKAAEQVRAITSQMDLGTAPTWPYDWATEIDSLAHASPMDVDATEPDHILAEAAPESTTIRVDSTRVARLGSLLSEIVTDRRRVENRLDQVRALTNSMRERTTVLNRTVNAFQKQFEFNLLGHQKTTQGPATPSPNNNANTVPTPRAWAASGTTGEFSELEFDRYDEASIMARSLAELANDFDQLLAEWGATLHEMEGDASQFKQTSREIQNAVSNLSLVPFAELAPRLQRVFRDALESEQKEGRLEFTGHETLLDKGLVERVYPALLHVVRNAVAHGLEAPAARTTAQKESTGRVHITCSQVANQIVLRIQDDGAGINEAAVRARGIAMGLLSADETTLRPAQILRLLSHSGFSTAATITDVSGRGVGMDVVRSEIEALKGTIDLSYEPGQGSTWIIRLPLTLSITEGVIISAGPVQYALPMNTVLGGMLLENATLATTEDGTLTGVWNGETLPVINLCDITGTGDPAAATYGLAVSSIDRKAIIAVTKLLGRAELPMKSLDPVTACHPLFESATIDPTGTIVPVLSASALMRLGAHGALRPTAPAETTTPVTSRPTVLVVDDSVSVRRVQTRMLESLGCEVIAAVDGLHALELLREHSFHMILTDLEMPRLNGYELIAEIRSNPAWAATPVIVISSRSADKYVAKAMNLGATSFLFKPFTEAQISTLLDHHIRRTSAAA